MAYLNYVIAKNTVKSDPTAAIPYFVKAAKYESDLKKNPLLYNELAAAYGGGPVAKYTEDYKAIVGMGKSVDSPESKLVIANLNQAIDRQIDAFARAAATHFSVAGYPDPTVAGVSHTFVVTALDAFNNTAAGYTGIVHLTSSDGAAMLDPNHTYTIGEAGVHTFTGTLKTAGARSITAGINRVSGYLPSIRFSFVA